MTMVVGEIDLSLPTVQKLQGLPQPYYNNGGTYIFYDGFEDGILRWSTPDNRNESNGFTGITSLNSVGNRSTRALLLGAAISGSTANQDANIDMGLAYGLTGSTGVFGPSLIYGIEFWMVSMDFLQKFSVSIERSLAGNKYEWKWSYDASANPRQWVMVTSAGGSDTEIAAFGQNQRPHGIPGFPGWVPVKIYADVTNTGSGATKIFAGGQSFLSTQIANQAVGGSTTDSGMIKFEFSVTNNSTNNIGDFLVDDVWISQEPSIP